MKHKLLFFPLIFFLIHEVHIEQRKEIAQRPTSKGIETHIIDSAESYINQYEKFVKDTFEFDIYVYAEDLSETPDYDSTELGRFYLPDQIIITTQEKYDAYRLADISQYKRRQYVKNNAFVKGVFLHEVGHAYFTQTILEMKMYNEHVDVSYNNFRLCPSTELVFGSAFIEEGFCEYCIQKMGESIVTEYPYVPKTISEIQTPINTYNLKYEYSSFYLRNFLDSVGIKEGLKMIISNRPPSYEEILKPNLYFNRIMN